MPKQNDLKRRKQNNLNQLRNILKNNSKKNAKQAEDINEIHKHNNDYNNNRINRYFAISLVKLANNHIENITYNKKSTKKDISAKQSSNNTLALIKSLKSIHFIKILETTAKHDKIIKKISITSLGKRYVKKYIRRNHQIYKYLKYGKLSMKTTKKGKQPKSLQDIPFHQCIALIISICFMLFPKELSKKEVLRGINYPISFNQLITYTPIFIKGVTIFIAFMLIIMAITYALIKRNLHTNENISKDIKNATRLSFVKFLKIHHIKQPDYRFGHNNNLPQISYYLFDTQKKN